jgi:hypothetical protein
VVGVKLIVILCCIIAYFSISIRRHSQNVSSDSRKWLIKHFSPPSSCKKQINKQNSYLLLAFLQSGSVPELDMHESKHFLPGQFVHSGYTDNTDFVLTSPQLTNYHQYDLGLSWSRSYKSWNYNYLLFFLGHCVVCSSSIYRFWLPLWYLQALLPTQTVSSNPAHGEV